MPEEPSRSRIRHRIAAALPGLFRAGASLCGSILVILLMAGLPLLVSATSGGGLAFTPMKIIEAAGELFRSIGDGSIFFFLIGSTKWDFRDIGPWFLWNSFLYTAIPGAFGIGLGTFAGAAFRRRRRGLLDRFSEFVLAVPDFLLIFAFESAAAVLVFSTGLRITLGIQDGRLAALPLLVMSIFPFFLAYQAASAASRRAESEEYIAAARARGLPERSILWRHLGAAVIPRLEAELPIIISFMQGSLFIAEKTFAIPGMARFLFDSAFAGKRRHIVRTVYQYNVVVLSLLGIVASCAAVYLVLRLSLYLARKALTRE